MSKRLRGDDVSQDRRWVQVHLKPARCVKDLQTPYGVNLSVTLGNSLPPLPLLFFSAVRFEDCQHNREVGFISSDPNFSVRPDGTVFTQQEVANLSEPVQFMVTARGLHDPHIWETTVKLALSGHPHPLPLTKVMRSTNYQMIHFHCTLRPCSDYESYQFFQLYPD